MFHKIALASVLSAVVLTGCNNAATTTAQDNPLIENRTKLMKDWRQANEGMKAMIENPATFDAATFKERADFIANTTTTMWTYFDGETAKGGDAQDAIWADAAGFKAETEKFTAAANALAAAAATATSTADVEALYGEMASSCGSCHKIYKK